MRRLRQEGFTVVEVFLVITLMALVVTLMIVPVQQLAEKMHFRPLEETVLSAVRAAHLEARQNNVSVMLHYTAVSNRLELATVDGVMLKEIRMESGPDRQTTETVRFFRMLPEDPKNESAAYESEDEPVEFILFHPAGASTPFAIEFPLQDVRLVMDPFSSEPLLREVEGNEV